jgi:hypothetical protein
VLGHDFLWVRVFKTGRIIAWNPVFPTLLPRFQTWPRVD